MSFKDLFSDLPDSEPIKIDRVEEPYYEPMRSEHISQYHNGFRTRRNDETGNPLGTWRDDEEDE